MLYRRLIINGTEYVLAVSQSGSGAPAETTVGAVGVLYMDTDDGSLYKCTGAADGKYTWEPLGTGNGTGQDGQNGEDGGYYIPEVTQLTDTTMEVAFTPSKAGMPAVQPATVKLPVGSGSGSSTNVNLTHQNFKAIAHRGYHVTAAQNSLQSIKDAADGGFPWVELDIRKCADGVYVLAHDENITLYSNGIAVSVTIANARYADIKNYTWDSDGQYRISTLQAAFAEMRKHGVKAILDRKSGTNTEIMQIAATSGMLDYVLLSYASPVAANGETTLLKKYKNIPIRVIPTEYAAMVALMDSVDNPVFADVNASTNNHKQQYLNIALSCGVPILFSGCTTSNYAVWAGVANGGMANDSDNISVSDFINLISADYDTPCTITADDTLTMEVGTNSAVSANSDVNGIAGYVYAYSDNPAVAVVQQTTFGQNINVTVTAKAAGSANVRLFTAAGAVHDIAVTVRATDSGGGDSGGNDGPIVEQTTLWLAGTTGSIRSGGNTTAILFNNSGSTGRATYVANEGTVPLQVVDNTGNYTVTPYYPVLIPAGCTKVTVTCPGYTWGVAPLKLSDDNWVRISDPGWQALDGSTYVFTDADAQAVLINLKYGTAGTEPITSVPDTVTVEFS